MKKSLILTLCCLTFLLSSQAEAQCTLTAKCTGGDWSDPATWIGGSGCTGVTVPGDNCYVVIPACATVFVDINSPTYNNIQIDVYGTLDFGNGQKINMCPGVVNVHAGGQLTGGTPGSKINYCGATVWNGGGTTSGPISYGGGTTLPIELISFELKTCGNAVCVTWSTASEQNNDYFSLERSVNGVDFGIAGILDGGDNSNVVLNYSFTDNTPYDGISYYRLKQTDYNGDHWYSPVVTIDRSSQKDLNFDVFPNPNDGENVSLSMQAPGGEEVLVVVYDAAGREAYSKVLITEEAETVYVIDPARKLSPGIYMVTASSRQSIYRKKMVVK
jgi:hypothetical protein